MTAAIKSQPVPVEPDKVLALARDAGYSTQIDVRNGLHTENIWGGELETAKVMRFAALIQREMEAENVCICGYTYAQHTYDKSCDSHGVCPNRQGVFRNERQHELIQKLDAENAELRKDAERYRWQMENPAIAFHYYKVRGFTTEYSAEIDRARSCK